MIPDGRNCMMETPRLQTELRHRLHEAPFHPLVPGAGVPGDWYPGRIPSNIEVGANTVVDSSFAFKDFSTRRPIGMSVGRDVTLWRCTFAVSGAGSLVIGDESYLSHARVACTGAVRIGSRVVVAEGALLTDSETPAGLALREVEASDPGRLAALRPRSIEVGDDVWIGYNAVVLAGVRIGPGAVVAPGAVVVRDVPAGTTVAGNPAQVIKEEMA
jgi:acetyltransferase-like isoleucine patch superfamily enzyme